MHHTVSGAPLVLFSCFQCVGRDAELSRIKATLRSKSDTVYLISVITYMDRDLSFVQRHARDAFLTNEKAC